jgi:hypothetical protein
VSAGIWLPNVAYTFSKMRGGGELHHLGEHVRQR